MNTEIAGNTRTVTELPAEIAVNRDELINLRAGARGLTLKPRQSRGSVLSGQHQSRFRGRGMDYLESRHYQPGDDVRNFDWRVTARTSQPHIKLYVEEREKPVVILTDLSASMSMASQGAFKSVMAARVAALLGWVAVAQGDRVGGLVYRALEEHIEQKPQGGRRGILRFIDALTRLGQPHTDFDAEHAGLPVNILERVTHMTRPGSQLIIISDFYYLNAQSREYLQKLQQHNNVLAIQIVDPLELSAPPTGEYGISDGVHSWRMNLNSSRQQQRLERVLSTRQQQIDALFSELGIPMLQIQTGDDVKTVLHHELTRKPASYMGNILMQGEASV